MPRSIRLIAAFAAAALLAGGPVLSAAAPAHAGALVATYTGQVQSFVDSEGIFGPAGEVLDGEPFVAQFSYTPSADLISDFRIDGAAPRGQEPFMGAVLTIKSVSWSYNDRESRVAIMPGSIHHTVQGPSGSMSFWAYPDVPPPDYFSEFGPFTGPFTVLVTITGQAEHAITLSVESVRIATADASPRPLALPQPGWRSPQAERAGRRAPPRRGVHSPPPGDCEIRPAGAFRLKPRRLGDRPVRLGCWA